jgi:hypothetical protein
VSFAGRHSGAINAGAKTGCGDGVKPGEQIRELGGVHAAALFLVKEDHSAGRESFPLRPGGCGVTVTDTLRAGVRDGMQFAFEAAVEEDEEAEAVLRECGAMAVPGVGVRAGRIVQPVACEGERLLQGWQGGIAWVVVRVEAEICRRVVSILRILTSDQD